MTGRSLPKDIISVVQGEPNTYVQGTGDGGSAGYTLKTTTRRTPKYGTDGLLLGYTVEIVDENGNVTSTSFEEAKGPATGITGKTSAFDMLTLELTNLGLSSLIGPLKGFFQEGITDADTLRLKLSQTKEYQTRFSANADRIKNGLSALSPAEYIALEDQYQNIMRNYGLPATYWAKDATGKQAGFDQLLANDVSATELEDRVTTAKQRVQNAAPEVMTALKQFYGDIIKDGDILAYALDPNKALTDIKRQVAAAEIGGAALQAGLNQGTTPEMYKSYAARAAELAAAGVTQQQAQQSYGTIAELAQRGGQLAGIYGESPYGQTQAEAEMFNIQGQTQAAAQRKKLTELEKASFAASSGVAQGALSRDRAISGGAYRQSGAGSI
jgi:hypothetical protein